MTAKSMIPEDIAAHRRSTSPVTHPSFTALLDHIEWQEQEIARLRARIEVDENDVDEAGIGDLTSTEDSPKILAWMKANGFVFVGHSNWESGRAGIWFGGRLVRESSPMADERVVNDLAFAVGRPPLDVLAEIAAMEVDDGE